MVKYDLLRLLSHAKRCETNEMVGDHPSLCPLVRPSLPSNLWCVHIISNHYLYHHSSYCFHVWTVNSPKWPSCLVSEPSRSSDFAKCWPLICRFVFDRYLCHQSLYYFHIGTMNSRKWLSDLISVPWHSSHFLLANVHYFYNHLLDCFHIATVNLTQWVSPLTSIPSYSSDLLSNACLRLVNSFTLIISTTTHRNLSIFKLWNHLSEPHNCSDFVAPQAKSCTRCGILPHWMLIVPRRFQRNPKGGL